MTLYKLSQYQWKLKHFMTLVVCGQRWTRDRVHLRHCGEGPDYPAGRPAQVRYLLRPCFFCCNSDYIYVQEGSPGGYEHRAPVQQTSAYWQGCYVCSWTKRRGEQNFCQSNMNENVDRLARPILETYVNSMRMKVCLGWPTPVEDRVQACSFGWRSWSLFQPVHTEERWINRK